MRFVLKWGNDDIYPLIDMLGCSVIDVGREWWRANAKELGRYEDNDGMNDLHGGFC